MTGGEFRWQVLGGYVAPLGKVCVRCGQPQALHRLPEPVRESCQPPICGNFQPPAPWWLRAATRLLGRRS